MANIQQQLPFMQDVGAPLPNAPFSRVGANQYGPTVKPLTKGSLVSFNYQFFKHDPYPLIVITDIFKDYIRGVNLHYLTFPFVKRILSAHCDNMMFSYFIIKNDAYIVNAFRTYKRLGVKQLKKLDCGFLLRVLEGVRTFNPAEVEAMRQYVRDQLRQQVNPRAEATGEQYMGMMRGQAQAGFEQPFEGPGEGDFARI